MPDLAGHSLPSPPDDSAKATIPPLAEEQEGVDFSAAVAHENHAATPLGSQEPPYILLVTDDRGFGQQVTAALVRLGYRTAMIQTADPAAAISRSAAERPDMVMLNIDALSLGGIGLSRRLKADTPGLRVLTLVHGHELAAAREEASISGADVVYGLLDLPLQLEEIVRDLLAQRAVASDSEKAPAEPPRSLQARIKSEARAFDFSALLDGVGTDRSRLATPDVELPAPVPEEDEHPWLAEPEIRRSGGPSMKSQRAPRSLKSAVFALVAIAAVAAPIYLLNSGALPTSEVNATPPPPGKPNIDLTVRKGMPFPPPDPE